MNRHARALEQAKISFPNCTLIVGVCSDATTKRHKGNTVLTESERYESLRHCKWVDEIVQDAPWVITQEFIDNHKIDFVAHDAIPYATGQMDDVYAFVKASGKFLATNRTTGVSTTDLITRIIKDYDLYVSRNLERGVSGASMNVSRAKVKCRFLEQGLLMHSFSPKQRAELWLKDRLRQTLYRTWQLYETVKSQWIPAPVSDKVDAVEVWVAPIAAKTLEMLFGVKVRKKAV